MNPTGGVASTSKVATDSPLSAFFSAALFSDVVCERPVLAKKIQKAAEIKQSIGRSFFVSEFIERSRFANSRRMRSGGHANQATRWGTNSKRSGEPVHRNPRQQVVFRFVSASLLRNSFAAVEVVERIHVSPEKEIIGKGDHWKRRSLGEKIIGDTHKSPQIEWEDHWWKSLGKGAIIGIIGDTQKRSLWDHWGHPQIEWERISGKGSVGKDQWERISGKGSVHWREGDH
jgi:hypothetical protein